MDGIELARRVHANPAIPEIALVLLTSSGMQGEADQAKEAGIAAYLTKPVRQSPLFECLATVIGGSPGRTVRPGADVTAPCPDRTGPTGHVLLAEDNPVNRLVAASMLKRLGFRVDVAVNGAEAVEKARLTSYGLILMDCQMPVLDGYEATQQIRSLDTGHRRTPIVAVTASAMKSDPQRCQAAGMDDYLAKPLSLKTLAAMLDRWAPPAPGARSATASVGGASPSPS